MITECGKRSWTRKANSFLSGMYPPGGKHLQFSHVLWSGGPDTEHISLSNSGSSPVKKPYSDNNHITNMMFKAVLHLVDFFKRLR